MLHERSFLYFENNGSGFKALNIVPSVSRNIDSKASFIMTEDITFQNCSVIIIGIDTHFPSKQNKGFIFGNVMMDRYFCPYFEGIQKTMALLIKASVEVLVHSQARRVFRLFCNLIHQLIIYDFHTIYFLSEMWKKSKSA